MNAQIEKLNAERDKLAVEAERFRQEMRWEPYKAFAVIIGGIAAMTGVILAVAHFIRP